jgi:hypothetical protein
MTSIALGNRRLLKLARQVDRRRRYNQEFFAHACGTPACAWGTHVINTPRLLKKARKYGKEKGHVTDMETNILFGINPFDGHAEEEFAISCEQANELFGHEGCGHAGKSAKDAASYIREFVKRRSKK